ALLYCFFFSSRRRHTRSKRDWSSDVCSSDLKELEQLTYLALQNSFSQVMANTLQELDEVIASGRDKNRFYLKDKRTLTFESVFGSVTLERNYYQDKKTGKY